MREHISYIGSHERGLHDMLEEGIDLPEGGVVLSYFDRLRDRQVTQVYPDRPSAKARAFEVQRARKTRRVDCQILSLVEAIA
ncbi:MAG: hypothetical protein HOC91_07935 [Nitrospinaceae bacterium]|nr:hypothetical protein [Nitrospinaceae bacterium]MBT3435525.1 hypothetical protein [Nitrospinaceae bacterium]MBT3820526.1 hypothetical protein [Nitrospinaceae bacterium]MBT4094882.1 hypothetical protein [Nitrospinaceae bacterium]MBT4430427.1 hypothetical protein [Nitrospinaceae bacterium]